MKTPNAAYPRPAREPDGTGSVKDEQSVGRLIRRGINLEKASSRLVQPAATEGDEAALSRTSEQP